MALRELNCLTIQFSHLLSIIISLPDSTKIVDKQSQFTDNYHIFKGNSITNLHQVKQM